MSVQMPEPDGAVLARRDKIVARAARHRAGRGRDRRRARDAALRDRRAHRLSPAADGGGAAGDHRAGRRRCCAIATTKASRWCRAAPAPRCPAARCRSPTACCSAWPSSTASARSISTTGSRWSSRASPISAITNAVAHAGFYYAPDPSSQIACTIGGNVAENSGGVHCLKYGMTTNNVLGCEMVLMTGEVLRLGGKHLDAGGYDLLGIDHRLGRPARRRHRGDRAHPARSRRPRAPCWSAFRRSEDAGDCVSAIIGAGIIPGGMEMMDKPAIHAVEEFVHAGYPLDVEALLIVELDGPQAEVDHLIERVETIAGDCRAVVVPGLDLRGASGCCSGPGARRRSRRSAASRRTTTAWTAPSRAPSCRWCWRA